MPQTIRTAPLQLSGHQAVEETVSTLLHEPAGDQPVLSLYADLSGSPLEVVTEIELRARAIIHVLPPESRESLAEGVERAKDFAALAAEVPEARGMAVFFRGGPATESIWIPLAFAVPMPTWVLVDRLPRLYHLMEAKQMFRNYVVVKVESDKLNIMELRMGRITERFLAQTDDDWGEIGRRIGREQFAERNRRRREQTVSSQADWLHAYVMKKPHSRVVLVGHPRDVELFAKSLSSAVVERMIDPNEAWLSPPMQMWLHVSDSCPLARAVKQSGSSISGVRNTVREDWRREEWRMFPTPWRKGPYKPSFFQQTACPCTSGKASFGPPSRMGETSTYFRTRCGPMVSPSRRLSASGRNPFEGAPKKGRSLYPAPTFSLPIFLRDRLIQDSDRRSTSHWWESRSRPVFLRYPPSHSGSHP